MTLSPERLAITIAAHAADRKASDIVALDLREVAGYTDFFVICSGNNSAKAAITSCGQSTRSCCPAPIPVSFGRASASTYP